MTRPAHRYLVIYLVIYISQEGIQSEQRKELMDIADVSAEDQYAVLNPL